MCDEEDEVDVCRLQLLDSNVGLAATRIAEVVGRGRLGRDFDSCLLQRGVQRGGSRRASRLVDPGSNPRRSCRRAHAVVA